MNDIITLVSNNIDELIVAITIGTFYVLLGIDDNVLSINYLKKFNVMCYFLFAVLRIVFGFSFYIIYIIFGVLSFLASLNVLEKSCKIEKSLGRYELLIFSFIKWFFFTKFYIFISVSILSYTITAVWYNNLILIGTLIIGLVFHQISFTKDYFGYQNFDFLMAKLKGASTLFENEDVELEEIKELLAFIVYMEDKDFFERKDLNNSVKLIYDRKKDEYIENLKEERLGVLHPEKIKAYWKKYWRGFSTLEMQVVRTTVLKNDSYQYTFRRKMLIEYVYSKFMYKAMKRYIRRYNITMYNKDKKSTDDAIHALIKMLFLQFYFEVTLKNPKNVEDFSNAIKSRLSYDAYSSFYETYKQDIYEERKYISLIEEFLELSNSIYI